MRDTNIFLNREVRKKEQRVHCLDYVFPQNQE